MRFIKCGRLMLHQSPSRHMIDELQFSQQ
uniref:Uncharacterized protein n=1 Tax=Anguilla anguilla TaxID=7936 RepID=A0A0E9XLA7_ANGAN